MIEWKVVFQVFLSLLLVLAFLYFLLPLSLKRRLPYISKRKGNIEVEEIVPLGRDILLISVRIKEKRYYILLSDKFAKILREEDVNTSSNAS